jgi:hypothetical protein
MSGGATRRHSSFWFYVLSKTYVAINIDIQSKIAICIVFNQFMQQTRQLPVRLMLEA